MPPETPETAPEVKADTADGGWLVESNSVPVELAPEDTTAAKPAGKVATPAAKVETPEGETADGDVESQSATADGTAAKPAKPAVKKKDSVDARKSSLQREIDTLTFQKHNTAREIADATQQLTRLRGELAQLQGQVKPPAADAKPAAAAAKPAGDAMPDHPKYSAFETDAEYEEAVAKWRGDVVAWQTAREERLKTEITSGLDTRLTTERQRELARQAAGRVQSDVEQAKAAHADWDEVAENLRDVRSPWSRDPNIPTPFLSDVAQNIAEGNGELIYWYASHPEETQVLANLQPTRAMRDAIVQSSSPQALLAHFATPEGSEAFERIKVMHPVRINQAIGALTAQLAAASSGPALAAPHPITAAVPSAKPPAGSPRARSEPSAGNPKSMTFEDWMAAEDAKEKKARLELMGIAASR